MLEEGAMLLFRGGFRQKQTDAEKEQNSPGETPLGTPEGTLADKPLTRRTGNYRNSVQPDQAHPHINESINDDLTGDGTTRWIHKLQKSSGWLINQ